MSTHAEKLRAAHAAYRDAEGTPRAVAAYAELERVVEDIKRSQRTPRAAGAR